VLGVAASVIDASVKISENAGFYTSQKS